MFAVRGLAVSLSVFVLVYGVLSLAVSLTWRGVNAWARHLPVHRYPASCLRSECFRSFRLRLLRRHSPFHRFSCSSREQSTSRWKLHSRLEFSAPFSAWPDS